MPNGAATTSRLVAWDRIWRAANSDSACGSDPLVADLERVTTPFARPGARTRAIGAVAVESQTPFPTATGIGRDSAVHDVEPSKASSPLSAMLAETCASTAGTTQFVADRRRRHLHRTGAGAATHELDSRGRSADASRVAWARFTRCLAHPVRGRMAVWIRPATAPMAVCARPAARPGVVHPVKSRQLGRDPHAHVAVPARQTVPATSPRSRSAPIGMRPRAAGRSPTRAQCVEDRLNNGIVSAVSCL